MHLRPTGHAHALSTWLTPFATVALAAAVRYALEPWVGSNIPFGLFFLSVAVTALYAGFWQAVLASVLSMLAVDYLFLEPRYTLEVAAIEQFAALVLFSAISLAISFLGRQLHRGRRKLEAAIMALRRQAALIDLSPDAIIVRLTDGTIKTWSKGAEELYGWKKEEAIGQTTHKLLQTEFPEPLERIGERVASGQDWSGELIQKAKDGRKIVVQTFWRSETVDRELEILESNLDITDRKLAEQSLRESENKYRNLFENMAEEVHFWKLVRDENGQIKTWRLVDANPPALKTWGKNSIEEVRGKTTDEIFGSGATEHYLPVVQKIMTDGTPYTFEDYFSHLDKYFRFTSVPIGEYFITTGADITNIKKAQKALEDSRMDFDRAQAVGQIGSWRLDTRRNELTWSLETHRIFGVPEGTPMSYEFFLTKVHPDDRQYVDMKWKAGLAGEDYDIEHRLIVDGKVKWVREKAYLEFGAGGTLLGGFGITQDITERKCLEEDLKAALLSAQQANAAKDQFLAVLSHELRTPLSPVMAAVQLMQRSKDTSEEGKRFLEIIQRNLQLEIRLIDDLLDLTRIVRGKIELEQEPIDIRTVIEHVVDTCKPDIEARKLHFGVDMKGASYRVLGDTSRLQQVLWNLLKNSIKFTPDGGCVGIRCFREGSTIVVEVTDSGVGIEADTLPRLFNAFEQGDERITRQFGGLGLGLAISKRLVEMHDGTITAYSAGKNQGATFRVSLPEFLAETKPEEAEKAEENCVARAAVTRRILLVEDHIDTATMISALLEASGYQVRTAGDVQQALRAVEQHQFDLLISDLGLPDRSGIKLMQEIRNQNKNLKAIALSGFGREEDVMRSKAAGFSEHLTKPVDADALLQMVERATSGD